MCALSSDAVVITSSRVKNSHVLILNAELLQRNQAAITRVMAISFLRSDAST